MSKQLNANEIATARGFKFSTTNSIGIPVYKFGNRASVGQYWITGTDYKGHGSKRIDMAGRVNFERSRYIPGNGEAHRLGRQA